MYVCVCACVFACELVCVCVFVEAHHLREQVPVVAVELWREVVDPQHVVCTVGHHAGAIRCPKHTQREQEPSGDLITQRESYLHYRHHQVP